MKSRSFPSSFLLSGCIMTFKTLGDRRNPAVLFFHAMGVTGESSVPVAEYLKDNYFVILPTSTVYSKGQKYVSKDDEVDQIVAFLFREGIDRLSLVVASSIGADLALSFLSRSTIEVERAFFDGGQFAQIGKITRRIMVPFLYLAIKSLYWSKGETLKRILWCDDDFTIKPYFIKAGENLTYSNQRRQMRNSLTSDPFPRFKSVKEENCYFEFRSVEEHFKYRENVKASYPEGNFPVFRGYNHMQYQIRAPEGFASMLVEIIKENRMPDLPFLE